MHTKYLLHKNWVFLPHKDLESSIRQAAKLQTPSNFTIKSKGEHLSSSHDSVVFTLTNTVQAIAATLMSSKFLYHSPAKKNQTGLREDDYPLGFLGFKLLDWDFCGFRINGSCL